MSVFPKVAIQSAFHHPWAHSVPPDGFGKPWQPARFSAYRIVFDVPSWMVASRVAPMHPQAHPHGWFG